MNDVAFPKAIYLWGVNRSKNLLNCQTRLLDVGSQSVEQIKLMSVSPFSSEAVGAGSAVVPENRFWEGAGTTLRPDRPALVENLLSRETIQSSVLCRTKNLV